MKIVIAIAFVIILLGAIALCGGGICKANAQTSVHTLSNYTKEDPKTVTLKITGMTCAGCSNQVAIALKELAGVIEQKVEYPGAVATVKYDATKTSVDKIVKAIEKLGYKAEVQKEKKA